MTLLEAVEFETAPSPRFSVVWLHGLGADGHDFEPIVPELVRKNWPGIRFIFPHAPARPVTINGGMRMPAWYDILTFDNPPLREQEADVRDAERSVVELVERERTRGIPPSQVVLAGFSQGGAMALHTGLRTPEPLAGVLVLSAYLLLPQRFDEERTAASAQVPVLFAHGRYDPVVPFGLGKAAHARLEAAGYTARWEAFDMEHSLCIEEVHSISRWLGERFPAAAKPAG